MIPVVLFATFVVGVIAFTHHYVIDWYSRRKRQQKSIRFRAEHIVNKHRGVEGAETEVLGRLAAENLTANERRYFENVLRHVRSGNIRATGGEIDVKAQRALEAELDAETVRDQMRESA